MSTRSDKQILECAMKGFGVQRCYALQIPSFRPQKGGH